MKTRTDPRSPTGFLAHLIALPALVSGASSQDRPTAAPPQAEAKVPTYSFQVGDELTYTGTGTSEASYGTTESSYGWTFWVVRANPDGTHRLVFRQTTKQKRTMANGKVYDYPESNRYAWVDMSPTGRFEANDSIALGGDPSVVLPPLPGREARGLVNASDRGTEAPVAGFTAPVPVFDRVYSGRATSGTQIEYTVTSPSHRNSEKTEQLRVTLDADAGVPARVEFETAQTGISKASSKSTLKLEGKTRTESDWPARFAEEAAAYFETKHEYDVITFSARTRHTEADALLEEGAALVRKASEDATLPEVQKLYQGVLDGHENRKKYVHSYAKLFAELLGNPSPEWECKNLDGEPRRLADFAGKVVVLDFWYRGCGWCVRAMPQMNALHEHYRGKPVAILGVNKDENLDDAHFTVDAVGLEYENLHSLEMPKLYNIRGYPTLVVLDQDGVVRDIHVGYSAHLKDELIEVIDGLLKQ